MRFTILITCLLSATGAAAAPPEWPNILFIFTDDQSYKTVGCLEEIAKFLKDGSDLCQELNTRWLEITQRVFALQSRLQQQLAEAGQGCEQRNDRAGWRLS
jgi:hypothetical protein